MPYPDVSTVSLVIEEKGSVLDVQLHNHRTRDIALAAQVIGPEKTKVILRSLLGLCPVAQVCAFDSAWQAVKNQTANSTDETTRQLITAEAILETIRVLSMDLQPYTIHGKVSTETLKTIGELRSRLCRITQNETVDDAAVQTLIEDIRALVILWFTREKIAINAIKHTFERFDDITVDGKALLFPEEIGNKEILKLFVHILTEYPDWALCPQLAGSRITGALARIRSLQNAGRKQPFRVKDLILARLQELKSFASGLISPFTAQSFYLDNGWGVGLVETARGSLMHFLSLKDNTMQFHIVAPTEWAFQEESPMVEVMNAYANKRVHAVKSVVTGLNLIGCAFDPCTKMTVCWPQRNI